MQIHPMSSTNLWCNLLCGSQACYQQKHRLKPGLAMRSFRFLYAWSHVRSEVPKCFHCKYHPIKNQTITILLLPKIATLSHQWIWVSLNMACSPFQRIIMFHLKKACWGFKYQNLWTNSSLCFNPHVCTG